MNATPLMHAEPGRGDKSHAASSGGALPALRARLEAIPWSVLALLARIAVFVCVLALRAR